MAPADETPSIQTGAAHMSLVEPVPPETSGLEAGSDAYEAYFGAPGTVQLSRQVEMAREDGSRRIATHEAVFDPLNGNELGMRLRRTDIRGLDDVMADVEDLSHEHAFLTTEGQVSLLELARELQEMGHLDLAEEIRDDIAEIVDELGR